MNSFKGSPHQNMLIVFINSQPNITVGKQNVNKVIMFLIFSETFTNAWNSLHLLCNNHLNYHGNMMDTTISKDEDMH